MEAIRLRLVEVRREITSATEHLQRLRDEEYGLSLSLARMTGGKSPSRPAHQVVRRARSQGGGRLTPAVRAILETAEQPLTRMEIAELLSEDGRDATPDAVSASLSYLRRLRIVVNHGGCWHTADEPPAAANGAPPSPGG